MSVLLALALAAASAPPASIEASPQSDAIVIQGVRDTRSRATQYVDDILPVGFDTQFGRYQDPICAKTIGLPEPLQQEVLDRIRKVATAAKIDIGKAGCSPNLLLVVIADKKAIIDGMRKERQSYLYGVGRSQQVRLASSSKPYAAWQIKDVIGASGEPLTVDGDGIARLFTSTPLSRLRGTTKPRTLGALVIVETRALRNVSTRQLADFALVRGLMPADQSDKDPPSSSVLSLFNAGVTAESGPQSLTWWDLAFLKSLRLVPDDEYASVQRRAIREQMLKEIAKGPGAER
jgi:hypothetical protein